MKKCQNQYTYFKFFFKFKNWKDIEKSLIKNTNSMYDSCIIFYNDIII